MGTLLLCLHCIYYIVTLTIYSIYVCFMLISQISKMGAKAVGVLDPLYDKIIKCIHV